jgi:hypothetical protein
MQIIRNIFGVLEPRTGKLTFSENALENMKDEGLDTAAASGPAPAAKWQIAGMFLDMVLKLKKIQSFGTIPVA